MKLEDAIRSGRKYKRKSHKIFGRMGVFVTEEVLADDWELEPEKKIFKCWVNFYGNGDSQSFSEKIYADDASCNIEKYRGIKRVGEAVEVTKEMEV